MADSPDISLEQIQQLVNTLKSTIEGTADMSRRIEMIEDVIREIQSLLVALRDNQQKVYTSYSDHMQSQLKLQSEMLQTIARLEERVDRLEGRRHLVM